MILLLSVFTCVGIMAQEPKRYYSKQASKNEISDFWLFIKRSEKTNNYDLLKFEAFKGIAKWINDNLHKGDVVQVRARPRGVKIKDTKTGELKQTIIFRVAFIEFVCHQQRLMLNEFGGDTFPQLEENDYMYWG